MNNTVFYSWQSDLPNNTNRSFIESCLKKAIKLINNDDNYSLEMNIDRDTLNEYGTPSIVDTIFEKIEKTSLFVADVSFINSDTKNRKCPNPNVLVELGYAAKTLGWNRIICVFNSDYGAVEDLPFDIRFRRPLVYNLNGNNKSVVRNTIAKVIYETIKNNIKILTRDNKISNFQKEEIDTVLLRIIGDQAKMLKGYNDYNLFMSVNEFVSYDFETVREKLLETKFIGFQILKNYESTANKLRSIFEKIKLVSNQNNSVLEFLVDAIKWLEEIDNFMREQSKKPVFIKTGEEEYDYFTLFGPDINPMNDDTYLLLKKIDQERGRVIDSGSFATKEYRNTLLKRYIINHSEVDKFTRIIIRFKNLIQEWMNLTNNEFIIDNLKNFRIVENPTRKASEIEGAFDYHSESVRDLLHLIQSINIDYFLNYFELLSLNFIILLINHGYYFKDHKMVVEKNLEKVYGIKHLTHNEKNIAILLDSDDKNSTLLVGAEEGKKLYENAKSNCTRIDKLLFNKEFLLLYKQLVNCKNDPDVSCGVVNSISKLINGINTNIEYTMKSILESGIEKYCQDNSLEITNIMSEMYTEYIEKYRRHDYDFKEVKVEIGKYLGFDRN